MVERCEGLRLCYWTITWHYGKNFTLHILL